ncbi:hypothetical protein V7799_28440 [Rhizobium laguerreae]
MEYWLGTDQFGRDVLSRMIYGSRNSLIFGITSPILAAILGTIPGVVAGYFGGITDRVVSSRVIGLLLAFSGGAARDHHRGRARQRLLGHHRGYHPLRSFRFCSRGRASKYRCQARALCRGGDRRRRACAGHHLPSHHAISPRRSSVAMTLWVASAIRLEASLSFLSIGTQPPNPS